MIFFQNSYRSKKISKNYCFLRILPCTSFPMDSTTKDQSLELIVRRISMFIKMPKNDKEIEEQNKRIVGYVINILISVITSLIIMFLYK